MKTCRNSLSELAVLLSLVAGSPLSALPPPQAQSFADCNAPTYASDVLVCATPELVELDRRLRLAIEGAELARLAFPNPVTFESNEAWLRRRSLCAFSLRQVDCLKAAYADRLAILSALQGIAKPPMSRSARTAICSPTAWGANAVRILVQESGPAVVIRGNGDVLAVASDTGPRDDWSPFMRFSMEGLLLRIARLVGNPIECRLTSPGQNPSSVRSSEPKVRYSEAAPPSARP
ncbi:MAG: hypothetical protein RL030_370 [Pseudomonadota bacterium]|jgi:uncharacterized protein